MAQIDRTEPALYLIGSQVPLPPDMREDLGHVLTSFISSLLTFPDWSGARTGALLPPDLAGHRALTIQRASGMAFAHAEGQGVLGSRTRTPHAADIDIREVRASVMGVMEAMPGTQQLGPGHGMTVGAHGADCPGAHSLPDDVADAVLGCSRSGQLDDSERIELLELAAELGLNRAASNDAHRLYLQAVATASAAAGEDAATRAGRLRQLGGQLAVSDADLAALAA